MATLQMTIDSSDDDQQPLAQPIVQQKEASKKKSSEKSSEKPPKKSKKSPPALPASAEPVVDNQDIILAPGNPENFFAGSDHGSESDGDKLQTIRTNLDGSKGNLWSFNAQLKTDRSLALATANSGEDTKDESTRAEPPTI